MLRSALVFLGVAAGLAAPAAASAATVQKVGTDLLVIADSGEHNRLTVSHSGSLVTVHDNGADLDIAGAGCFADGDDIACADAGLVRVNVDVGNLTNEVAVSAPYEVTINGSGGSTNEFDATGATSATLHGGPGEDELIGSEGDDEIDGGAADDTIVGSGGADEVHGDGGLDTYSYVGSSPVVVTLDDLANDGEPGENDNIHSSVDRVVGTSGNDEITGSPLPNWIEGNGGNDTLRGGDGQDEIDGGSGQDTIEGGDGEDILHGGSFGDTIDGGRDDDELYGDDGADRLDGGGGGDVISGGTSGNDTVDYTDRISGVTVDLDGSMLDDGESLEGDSVGADVETIEGGSGDDTLTGTADNEKFLAGAGEDVLDGGAGSDILVGGADIDAILAADGFADSIACQGDADDLTFDPNDNLDDCPLPGAPAAGDPEPATGDPEPATGDPVPGGGPGPHVGPAAGGGSSFGPPPTPPSTPVTRAALAIGPSAVRLTKKRDARIKLSCSSANCTGTLRLTRKVKGKTVVVGRARYSVAAGKSRVVKVRVSKTTVRRIGRRGLKVTASAGTTKRTITVKRAR
jgi:Ca2+-binding RTX toxin-like protein